MRIVIATEADLIFKAVLIIILLLLKSRTRGSQSDCYEIITILLYIRRVKKSTIIILFGRKNIIITKLLFSIHFALPVLPENEIFDTIIFYYGRKNLPYFIYDI